MSIAQNFPTISPSLLLDFASVQALDPRITYSRASTATYYGTRTAKAEENLFQYSQDFTAAVGSGGWAKYATTITANSVAAPDGTTTASTVTSSGTSAPRVAQNKTSTGTYVFSIYLKQGTDRYIQLIDTGLATDYANFDLQAGVVTFTGATVTASITSAGSGWYRCTISRSLTGTFDFAFGFTDNNPTAGYAPTLTNTGLIVYAWGAQLEPQSSARAYQVTTTQPITNYIPVLETAASGVARFDHNPTTFESLGLLVEQQSTNLLLQSENFSLSWSLLRTTNSITNISPVGTQTANQLVETTATGTHVAIQTISKAASAITYTASVYLKAAGRNNAELRMSDQSGNGVRVVIDLSAGTTGTPSIFGTGVSAGVATISTVGNGWYRITLSGTSNSATTWSHEVYILDATLAVSYAGNGYSGLFVWGAQLEAAAFPTSYIPTVASQVTRAADSASMTGTNFSSWYNQSQGSLYIDFVAANPSSAVVGIVSIGANNNYIDIRTGASLTSVTLNGGVQQTGITMATYSANTPFRGVTAYQSNDFAAAANGGTVGTDSLGLVPTANTLYLASTIGVIPSSCTIKKLSYYPIRLSNTNLQALTG
jgi:hypothetical protein